MKLLKRPLALSCAAFVICSVIGYFHSALSAYLALAFALISAVLLALCFIFKKECGRVLFTCFFCALFSCSSFFVSYMHFQRNLSVISEYYGREVTIYGYVTEVEYTAVYGGLYSVRTMAVDGTELDMKMILETDAATLSKGEIISAAVVIRPFEDNVNGYSEKLNYMSDGYIAKCESTGEGYKSYGHRDESFLSVFDNAREFVTRRFKATLSARGASLYSAVFAGDGSDISDVDMLSVRRSGTSHLLAVSGMHFSVIMAVILSILTSLGIPIKARNILLSIIALTYMAFTGFSPSVTRSGIMLFVTYLGSFSGKIKDMFTSLMLTVTVMLAISPYLILNASFLLSSSATLGIILLLPALSELFERRHKRMLSDILRDDELSLSKRMFKYIGAASIEFIRGIPSSMITAVTVSIFALAFSLPFSLLFFESISLVSIPCGIILTPVVTFVLISAPFVLIFGGIPALGYALSFAGDAFFYITRLFSDIDGVYLNIGYTATKVIIFVFFAVIAITVLFVKKRKILIPIVSMFLIAVISCSYISEAVEFSSVDITYKATTDSDAICVRADNGLVIADMGSDSRSDIKAAVASASSLKENDVSAYVFTTVKSKSVSLVSYLVSNCKVDTVYFPIYASRHSAVLVEAAAEAASNAGVRVGYFSFGDGFYVDGCFMCVNELEYLSRSTKPIYSVRIERRDKSIIWCSRSYFEGEKSEGVYTERCDAFIFGNYGPKVKDSCTADIKRILAERFIISEDDILASFDQNSKDILYGVGLECVGEQVYRYSLRSD